MKNSNIVSGIKTASVVLTAAFTMSSCGNKALSEQEVQLVKHKADSAASVHPEYRIASGMLDLCEAHVERYRRGNKDVVKMHARDYIVNNIKDAAIARLMLDMLKEEVFLTESYSDTTASEDGQNNNKLAYIRKEYRWFNDLMLYLTGQYTERQFLNSEFFKVINNPSVKKCFEKNLDHIELIEGDIEFVSGRKTYIYKQLTDKYTKEVQKQR